MASGSQASPMQHLLRTPALRTAAGILVAFVAPGASAQEPAAPPTESHIGTHVATLHGLETPIATAFGPTGKLYVLEEVGDRVSIFGPDLAPLGTLGEGQLRSPQGIAVHADGSVFVSDGARSQVLRFPVSGGPPTVIGDFGALPGQMNQPRGLALHGDLLAVADTGGGRVALYGVDGESRGVIATPELNRPVDVAFDEQGQLAVLDGERVLLFDKDGTHLQSFGAWGAFPGLLSSPRGLARFGERIYVCDTENHRVQVFDAEGGALYSWGLHAIRPREGKGKLHYPSHVALNASGTRAALPEPLDGRVQIFERAPGPEPEPDPLRSLRGKPSAHLGQDWRVSANLMAAVEPESRRVLVFDLRLIEGKDNPVQITTIGGYGQGLGFFERPTGLWLDGPGRQLWICDAAQASLTEVHLDLAPDAALAVNPLMPQVIRSIDLARLSGGPLPRPFPITPRAVEKHPDGRLFVLCERNREVLVLSPSFEPLTAFGAGGEEPLMRPVQLALSPDGEQLWIVDELAGKVRAFSTQPDSIGVEAANFDAEDALVRPFGIAFGPANELLVSDRASSRIHIHAADGSHRSLGAPGIRHDEFLAPRALGFDASGKLYVLDHGNHRGMVLDPAGAFHYAFGPRLYTKPARLPHTYKPEDYAE
ncbi:MAG: DNA-binding beta-propeller fold protein YncE [Planctomycetota bacterium]|jgi:DNA-binding beta-propeller fold protein YncE